MQKLTASHFSHHRRFRNLSIGATLFLATLVSAPKPTHAQTVLPNPASGLNFQTSGPLRCATVGDWYTTLGINANPGPENGNSATCGVGDFATAAAPNQNTNSTDRIHRFFFSITPADLAAAGGSIIIRVEDAESNGTNDEQSTATTTNDPTQFQLLQINGDPSNLTNRTLIQSVITPSGSPNGTTIFFPAITQPGLYEVTSLTGQGPINTPAYVSGTYTPGSLVGDPNWAAALNDDDNGFRLVVPVSNLLIGQFQGSFQRASGVGNIPLYLLVGPGTGSLFLRNFDADNGATFQYTSPTGANTTGTPSGNRNWNGNSLNVGGDTVPVGGLQDSGVWTLTIGSLVAGNQLAVEGNSNLGRLPIFDSQPTRAGNFTITADTTRQTAIGQQVCHPFRVANNFFTNDIINLALSGTNSNYTVQIFTDPNNDGVPDAAATDSDGDINGAIGVVPPNTVDTGIMTPGQTSFFVLCVTPGSGATPSVPDNTVITGTSFMDRVVRQKALADGIITAAQAQPATQFVTKITNITSTAPGGPNFRLVKRITAVIRGGVRTNFTQFEDDGAASTDDTSPGWAAAGLLPVGTPAIPVANPLKTGDEVEYTLYFLSEGGSPALAVNICDQLQPQTTFIANSVEVKVGTNSVLPSGTFFPPLNPLPPSNSCTNQNNPDGSVLFDAGDVPNTPPGNNVGFARFRVRLN